MSGALRLFLLAFFLLLLPGTGLAQDTPDPAPQRQEGLLPLRLSFEPEDGESTPGRDLSTAVEVVLFLSVLTVLPALLLTMTCFTRIVIVLSFVRRAMSTPELPPNPIVIGLALFLSMAVMEPVASDVYHQSLRPYLDGDVGFEEAGDLASRRLKDFMLDYTREQDVDLFLGVAGETAVDSVEEIPLRVVVPAFVLSELKTAFTMGFVIYLPFLVVDIVIASILLSMGMFMLPPMLIATPIKILLFVLVDGWHLIIGELFQGLVL